jgi:hypothetical protein
MGGLGSGSWYRWNKKAVAEDLRDWRIDVRDWHREGLLRGGDRFSWCWCNADGEKVASIDVSVELEQVRLYKVQQVGSEWQERDLGEPVRLTWTACRYGGQRPWFVCPGRSCGRRAAVLYFGGRYFLCRRCYALSYASQHEDKKYRALRRTQKIRMKLGGSPALAEHFPDKHKAGRAPIASASRSEGECAFKFFLPPESGPPVRIPFARGTANRVKSRWRG